MLSFRMTPMSSASIIPKLEVSAAEVRPALGRGVRTGRLPLFDSTVLMGFDLEARPDFAREDGLLSYRGDDRFLRTVGGLKRPQALPRRRWMFPIGDTPRRDVEAGWLPTCPFLSPVSGSPENHLAKSFSQRCGVCNVLVRRVAS